MVDKGCSWSQSQDREATESFMMKYLGKPLSLLSVVDSLDSEVMAECHNLSAGPCQGIRLCLGNLYRLKVGCSNSTKEGGVASKKGKQYPGSEGSPEHREEAGK